MPATAYTPQLQFENSALKIMLSPATYPAAQTTSVYAVNSNLVAEIDRVAAVVVLCSNTIANNDQVLLTFTSAVVEF